MSKLIFRILYTLAGLYYPFFLVHLGMGPHTGLFASMPIGPVDKVFVWTMACITGLAAWAGTKDWISVSLYAKPLGSEAVIQISLFKAEQPEA